MKANVTFSHYKYIHNFIHITEIFSVISGVKNLNVGFLSKLVQWYVDMLMLDNYFQIRLQTTPCCK